MPAAQASLPAPEYRAWLVIVQVAVVGLCAGACAAISHAADVWVVTDSRHPVEAQPGARVTELDAVRRIESHLTQTLPSNPAQAAAVSRQRLDALTPGQKRSLAAAYQGVVDAWSVGVTKIPAVIVDRRYIVYGERDVARALREIERYRSTQR